MPVEEVHQLGKVVGERCVADAQFTFAQAVIKRAHPAFAEGGAIWQIAICQQIAALDAQAPRLCPHNARKGG